MDLGAPQKEYRVRRVDSIACYVFAALLGIAASGLVLWNWRSLDAFVLVPAALCALGAIAFAHQGRAQGGGCLTLHERGIVFRDRHRSEAAPYDQIRGMHGSMLNSNVTAFQVVLADGRTIDIRNLPRLTQAYHDLKGRIEARR